MPRCNCSSASRCSCNIEGSDGNCIDVVVTGQGTLADKFIVTATPNVSIAAGNQLTCGAGGLFVPAPPVAVGEVDIFVAASNTPADRQAKADYVCNGVADQVEIQAAIDQLGVGAGNIGGRVYLMEGTFNTTATIQMKNKVSLFGLGRADGTTTINFVGATYAIENLGFDGLTLANLYILHEGGGGIHYSGSDLCNIHNLDVFGFTSTLPGIFLEFAGGWLENCSVEVDDSDGIVGFTGAGVFLYILNNHVRDGGLVLLESVEVSLIGNKISQDHIPTNSVLTAGLAALRGSGLVVAITTDSIISENSIQSTERHGIALSGSDLNLVTSNYVQNIGDAAANTFDSIFLESSNENMVQVNRCHAINSRYAINISDAASNDNLATNNDLLNGYTTAAVNNAGTGTIVTAGNRL